MLQLFSNLTIMLSVFPIVLCGFTFYAHIFHIFFLLFVYQLLWKICRDSFETAITVFKKL